MKPQLQCIKVPVRDGMLEKLQAWMACLADRRDEVLHALNSEGIRDECVFITEESGRGFVYLYSRSDDLEAAARAFERSTLALDLEFKALMQECLDFASAQALPLAFAADTATASVYSDGSGQIEAGDAQSD